VEDQEISNTLVFQIGFVVEFVDICLVEITVREQFYQSRNRCLYEMDGKKRFGVVYEEAKQIKNIFLPLSSHCMLAGVSSSESQFNFDVINEAIARCSQEYFVCSLHSEDFLKLCAIIGEDAVILSNDELEQIVDELMQSRVGIHK